MHQGPSGSGPRPDDTLNYDAKDQKEDDPMIGKGGKINGNDLRVLERGLLGYEFSEDDDS